VGKRALLMSLEDLEILVIGWYKYTGVLMVSTVYQATSILDFRSFEVFIESRNLLQTILNFTLSLLSLGSKHHVNYRAIYSQLQT